MEALRDTYSDGAEAPTPVVPEHEAPSGLTRILPFAFARRFQVLVTNDTETDQNGAVVYCVDRPNLRTSSELRRFLRHSFTYEYLTQEEFNQRLEQAYSRDASDAKRMVEDLGEELDLVSIVESIPETEDLLEQEDDAPIIRLINALLAEAIRENASDIHIETFEKNVVVRLRVDGVLREVVKPKRALAPLLVSRIKIMAKLDIAEKRVPQDGRTSLRIGGRNIDVRVSTMPTGNGERVVLRLLDKQAGRLMLSNLGMDEQTLNLVRDILRVPHGILLATGPTGSGKTTTLYASLTELNTELINILTVEDPIEYNLYGIGQTQVNLRADLTFARGLRAILRQDPDIVMVGEIRDLETAEIAVQASLTGHLVMSTLHANTAVGTITRLVDMGIEPYLVATSLVGVLAQRLVRVLCPSCRREHDPNAFEHEFLGPSTTGNIVYRAHGCDQCAHSGYRGRTGIYEFVKIDDQIRKLIHDGRSEQEIGDYIHKNAPTIREDGRQKVIKGITTIQEILRVTLDS